MPAGSGNGVRGPAWTRHSLDGPEVRCSVAPESRDGRRRRETDRDQRRLGRKRRLALRQSRCAGHPRNVSAPVFSAGGNRRLDMVLPREQRVCV